MKTFIFLLASLTGLIFFSCTAVKEKTADELLQDKEMENEIYSSILKDSAHFSKFMNKMMADENCKTMMNKNSSLVKMVCLSEKMDSLISYDPQIMKSMSDRLFKINGSDSFACDKKCTKTVEGEFLYNYSKRKHARKNK